MAKFIEISENRIVNVDKIIAILPPGWEEFPTHCYSIRFSGDYAEPATKEDVEKILGAEE